MSNIEMDVAPMEWDELFLNGTKRSPGRLYSVPHEGPILNLGSGNAPMTGEDVHNLDRPTWEAPLLPFGDATVAAVHMYHFLEHLSATDGLKMLEEIDRVLMPRGCCYISVPHAMCPLGYQAPDHRTFWTEEGLQDTFYSAGYDTKFGKGSWTMDITWMMVAGVKWSNMCVLAQLVKQWDGPIETPWRRS